MKLLSLLLFLIPFFGIGQIAAWDFTGENTFATSTADLINPNLVGSNQLTRGANAIESAGVNSFRTQGFLNDGVATTNLDYFQNTLQAAAGYTLSLSSIDGRVAGTGSFSATPGVTMQFAYSLDGTIFTLINVPFIQVGNGNFTQIDLTGISALQNVASGTTVTIRFYASGQTTTGGWGFNSNAAGVYGIAFGGTVNPPAGCNTFNTLSTSACATYTVPSGDETYTASGTYTDTIPNAALCDSILTINLTINVGTTYYADTDLDGFGNPLSSIVSCTPVAGYVLNNSDCDDTNGTIGAGTITYYLDSDGDGFGSTTSLLACTQPVGYSLNSADCNDANNNIFPSAFDIPDNGIDEDCSGSDASAIGTQLGIYEFTAPAACPVTAVAVTAQPANAVFSNYGTVGTTCSQANNVFSNSVWNMGATIDLTEYNEFSIQANPCFSMDLNRIIFTHRISGSGGAPTWTLRSSLDNYTANLGSGTPLTTDRTDTITLPTAFDALTQVTFRFYITNMGQAGATWRNDNVRLIGNMTPLALQTFYADTDNDTFGNTNVSISACSAPAGYVLNNTDCDDNNTAINPNSVWYENLDGDAFGNTAVSFAGCTPPSGYTLAGGDCDDNDVAVGTSVTYYTDNDNDGFGFGPAIISCTALGTGFATQDGDCNDTDEDISPSATEICDGLDNNCDGNIDEGFNPTAYFVDIDNDGYGTGAPMLITCLTSMNGLSLIGGDCNDNNDAIFPGAIEIANDGIDQNCDGVDGYLSIDVLVGEPLTVFPNPTSGILTINQEKSELISIELVDLTGKVVYTSSFANESNSIDISRFQAGSYFLNLKSEHSIQRLTVVKY